MVDSEGCEAFQMGLTEEVAVEEVGGDAGETVRENWCSCGG